MGPQSLDAPPETTSLRTLGEMSLILPRPYNVVRKLVNDACAGLGMVPTVIAEIESASTLKAAIAEGLGATVLPESMAREFVTSTPLLVVTDRRARDCRAPGALQSDHLPLSEPAQAVKDILLEIVAEWPDSHLAEGSKP